MQANFHYDPTEASLDAAGVPLVVSIYADRAHIRDLLKEDAETAGFRPGQVGDMALLLERQAHALGDVILVDCPAVSAGVLAALSRLDMRAEQLGAQMIVATSVGMLDDVFACLDRSAPQILIDPTRGERVIALGRALAKMPGMRLREMTKEDRVSMLRLTEQVAQIAERLERMDARGVPADGGAFRFESSKRDFHGPNSGPNSGANSGPTYRANEDLGSKTLIRPPRPPLPDPRLVRKIIRQRQLRARYFDAELFADPAWDILLDLTAARAEHSRVSVTSLCIASGVPPTTALRWISQMVESGQLERVEDEADKRRAFIALSDDTADAMARYFQAARDEAAEQV